MEEQVEIQFSIGKYKDKILCDVVLMEASHVLLGRPWHFDQKAHHNGHKNKYIFYHDNRKVTLVLLSPKEVCDDQSIMREKREQERKENEKEKKKKERDPRDKEKEKREKKKKKKWRKENEKEWIICEKWRGEESFNGKEVYVYTL